MPPAACDHQDVGYAIAFLLLLLGIFCTVETYLHAIEEGLCDTGADSCDGSAAVIFMVLAMTSLVGASVSAAFQWRRGRGGRRRREDMRSAVRSRRS